jgi:hypothetical protein
VGVVNQVFKPSLVQKHTRIRVYKILARSVLTSGSEAWMISKREESRITAAEMKFLRQTAGYTHMDHRRNTDIMKELNTEQIMNFIPTYRANWKCHILRMPHSRIPSQMLYYQSKGKRFTGRTFKQWNMTVLGC